MFPEVPGTRRVVVANLSFRHGASSQSDCQHLDPPVCNSTVEVENMGKARWNFRSFSVCGRSKGHWKAHWKARAPRGSSHSPRSPYRSPGSHSHSTPLPTTPRARAPSVPPRGSPFTPRSLPGFFISLPELFLPLPGLSPAQVFHNPLRTQVGHAQSTSSVEYAAAFLGPGRQPSAIIRRPVVTCRPNWSRFEPREA
jgi:hypothetical protein